jgi:hypothetical protein
MHSMFDLRLVLISLWTVKIERSILGLQRLSNVFQVQGYDELYFKSKRYLMETVWVCRSERGCNWCLCYLFVLVTT